MNPLFYFFATFLIALPFPQSVSSFAFQPASERVRSPLGAPPRTARITSGLPPRVGVTPAKATRNVGMKGKPIDDDWRIRNQRELPTDGKPSTVSSPSKSTSLLKSVMKKPTESARRFVQFGLLSMGVLSIRAAVASASSTTASMWPTTPAQRVAAVAGGEVTSIFSWQWLLAATLLSSAQLLPLLASTAQNACLSYTALLAQYPIATKSVSAAVIGFVGDYMAQYFEYRIRKKTHAPFALDWRRAFSIVVDGIAISGPLMHYGYNLFEHILPTTASGEGSILAAIVHVLADSILLDSIFVATTFIVTGFIEGYKASQIREQIRNDYFPTLKASWAASTLVFPIELACFRLLPLSFRVLAVNCIDVLWDAVISFMAHRSRKRFEHATSMY